ncbi:MAG: cyanophycinase [Actinomycetota bacterium]
MADSDETAPAPRRPAVAGRGPVILIGGAEDKRRERTILTRFVELAGPDAKVAIIATASDRGAAGIKYYGELFRELGAEETEGARPLTREEADDPATSRLVDRATAVFLTGGNQIRLTSVVAGTRLADALFRAHDRGATIAGTSAGASALPSHMLAYGRKGEVPKHRMVHIAAGLGIVDGVVVDQHFEQRGRLGRLVAAVAQSPGLIGVGLDEDTAAIVWADRTLEVVGRGAVTIVDGSRMQTDAHVTKGHRPMLVSGVVMHSLPDGYRFDLRTRTLAPIADAEELEASE